MRSTNWQRFCIWCLLAAVAGCSKLSAESSVILPASLPGNWIYYGRGEVKIGQGSATLQEGFAATSGSLKDCIFTVIARAPEGTKEVEIWGGIRCRDREHRYVFALRGGADPELFLARYSPDGSTKFLGYAPLDEAPAVGAWQKLRVVALGNRIQVYIGDESLPRINVEDKGAPWQQGGVAIGGGWLPAEFVHAEARPLTEDEASKLATLGDQIWQRPAPDREGERKTQRAAYLPVSVRPIAQPRTTVALDGAWLFQPGQLMSAGEDAAASKDDDSGWHVIKVPGFWGPALPWLYGEEAFGYLRGVSRSKGIADKLLADTTAEANAQTFDWQKTKSGWYRHHLEFPANIAGKHVELCFEAIAKVSEIWFNGQKVADHTGMFGEVRCDISKWVHEGDNVVAVHIIPPTGEEALALARRKEKVAVTVEVTKAMLNSLPHGSYPEKSFTAGIWQPVTLEITDPVAVQEVFARPRLDGGDFAITLRNAGTAARHIGLAVRIVSAADGSVLHNWDASDLAMDVPASASKTLTLSARDLQPKLWSPREPNLYRLEITLSAGKRKLDEYVQSFGFRTFAVRGSQLLLNGKPYWLRGGDLVPNILRPNDEVLAHAFFQFAKEGNVEMARSHTAPLSEAWLRAADETGFGVLMEGTWPWLMLTGEPPSAELLSIWKEEWISIIKKQRNHPSILVWTVNNEMKFPRFDQKDPDLLRRKWTILDDTIRAMRQVDPTRPIVPDSSYTRKDAAIGYKSTVKPNAFDDGDIDDLHGYYGWYGPSFFHFYHGEIAQFWGTPGRPLISQEMSTGYPRNDGHPTRSYLYSNLTPQALVGDYAYENNDPDIFLSRQNFMTKELTETVRRADHDDMAGVLCFSYMNWIRNVWEAKAMQPLPAYYGVKTALQPVLVSAELFGRHWYAGATQTRRVCIVNDSEDGRDLDAGRLTWELRARDKVLASGSLPVPAVPYYQTKWIDLTFETPGDLPAPRVDAKLTLRLEVGETTISTNEYDVLLATKAWTAPTKRTPSANVLTVEPGGLDTPGAPAKILQFARSGGRVLLMHPGSALEKIFPGEVGPYTETAGEMVNARIAEHRAFDGLEPLDMAWFEMGNGAIPRACSGSYGIIEGAPHVTVLATQYDLHGYLERPSMISKFGGSPLLEIRVGKGIILASEMMLEARDADPVAARLLQNLLGYLQKLDP